MNTAWFTKFIGLIFIIISVVFLIVGLILEGKEVASDSFFRLMIFPPAIIGVPLYLSSHFLFKRKKWGQHISSVLLLILGIGALLLAGMFLWAALFSMQGGGALKYVIVLTLFAIACIIIAIKGGSGKSFRKE